jgi:hypothetical protein
MSFNRAPVYASDHTLGRAHKKKFFENDVVRGSDSVRAHMAHPEPPPGLPPRPQSALPASKPRAPWGLTCDTPRTRGDLTDQNGARIGGRAIGACSPAMLPNAGSSRPSTSQAQAPINPARPESAMSRAPWEETDYRKVEHPAMWLAGRVVTPGCQIGYMNHAGCRQLVF